MNKKVIGIIISIVIIIGVFYFISIQSLPLIPEDEEVLRFSLNDEIIEDPMIVNDLKSLLSKYDTKIRFFYDPFPMNENDYGYRIDYYFDGIPRHIVMGEDSFVYSGSVDYIYMILDPESFEKDIDKLLEKYEMNYWVYCCKGIN